MADDVQCDCCGKPGRRPRRHPCPKSWFYLEAKDSEQPDNPIIMCVCSKECALLLWKQGPGERFDFSDRR
jgi:hypothetical protein